MMPINVMSVDWYSFLCIRIYETYYQWFKSLFSETLFFLTRYDGDGCTHDVHHSVSDDCEHRAQRLEATDVGLRMVVCVSVFILNHHGNS